MNLTQFFLLIFLGVPTLVVVIAIFIYNSLVGLRNQCRNGWSQIDVQLKRRHDLIPNLIETVKGYAEHEKKTLEQVIQARNAAQDATGVKDQASAEAGLSSALSNIFALAESYPELKANENFLALQEELTSTENRIGFARQHYNDSVMTYNTRREVFPANIVAGMFNFEEMEFFELAESAQRAVPQVNFQND